MDSANQSEPTGSWCNNCNAILPRLTNNSSSENLGPLSTLLASAHSGCQICSIVLAEIQEHHIANGKTLLPSSDGAEEETIRLVISDRKTPVRITIQAAPSGTDLGTLTLGITDPGMPLAVERRLHAVDRRSFSAYPHWSRANASSNPELMGNWIAFNLIAWMNRCKSEHGNRCNRDFGGDVPTRLVEISDDVGLRLVQTGDLPEPDVRGLQYASVSHVWGTADMLKLTQDNIDEFNRGIPFHSLPRKFQEIIVLAYQIGLNYVWIDTLCIVQDDPTDWRREAGRMADVYRNAAINLAAIGGSREDICFTARNILGLYRAAFSVQHPQVGRIVLYLSRSNEFVNDMFNLSQQRPPALRRGWIWQERFLSRRTVYLGGPQFAWECGDCLWLESTGFTNHYDKLAIWTYCKRTIHGTLPQNWNFLPEEDELGRWKSHWDNFIAAYTDAGLTYRKDKLAAVAGIARHFQQESGQRYVGGMWGEQFAIGALLWETSECLPRPAFRGAPSWSWAAIDGKLSFGAKFVRKADGMRVHVPRTEVVRLDVTPGEDEDPIFGWNTSAIIHVRGRLFQAEYILEEEGTKIEITALTHVVQGVGDDFTSGRRFKTRSGDVDIEDILNMESIDDLLNVDNFKKDMEERFETSLDAPIEEQSIWACVLSTEDSYLDGLLLSRSPNGFRRLGMFSVSYSEGRKLAAIPSLEENVIAIE